MIPRRLQDRWRGRPRAIPWGMLLPLVEAIAWPGAQRSAALPWFVQGVAAAVTVPFTA